MICIANRRFIARSINASVNLLIEGRQNAAFWPHPLRLQTPSFITDQH